MSSPGTTNEASTPSTDPAQLIKVVMDPEDDDDDDDDEGSDTLNASPAEDGDHSKQTGSKRPREDDEDLSRSERKRHREKNRRNALNHRLETLAALLFKIDPTLKSGKGDQPIMNRVNLIQSAVQTLERIHKENEERKIVINDLGGGGGGGGGGPSKVGQVANSAPQGTADAVSEAEFLAAVTARRQQAFLAEQQAILAGYGGPYLGGRMDHLFGMGMGPGMMNPGFDILAAQRRMFAQAHGFQTLGGPPPPVQGKKEQET